MSKEPDIYDAVAELREKSKTIPLRKPSDIMLTNDDINLCLGSGELKRCPFCGDHAMSSGEVIHGLAGTAVRWTIQCTGSDGLIPNCFASVLAVDKDKNKARAVAVQRWNKRKP